MKLRYESDIKICERCVRGLNSELIAKASCIFLVGSYAEGLASRTSDIDLVLICKSPKSLGVSSSEFLVQVVENIRLEILVVSEEDFTKKINSLDDTKTLSRRELEYLHEFTSGIALLNSEFYCSKISDFNFNKFIRITRNSYMKLAASVFDDILGAKFSNDPVSAIQFSRYLIELGSDMLLASLGDTYAKPKWRLKRVKRALGEESIVYKEIFNRLIQAPSENEDLQWTWVEESILFFRELQAISLQYSHITSNTQLIIENDFLIHPNPWLMVLETLNGNYAKGEKTIKLDTLSSFFLLNLTKSMYWSELLEITHRNLEAGKCQERISKFNSEALSQIKLMSQCNLVDFAENS